MSNDTSNTILKAIETMVKNEVNQLQADITEKGIIKKIANKSERKYEATYQGVSIYLYAKEGEQYNQGDEVYFVVPKGDLSNKKIIQGLVNAEPAAPFYTNGPTWDVIYRPKDENEKLWSEKTYGLKMREAEDSIFIYSAERDKEKIDINADNYLFAWGVGAETFTIQATFWTKLYDINALAIEEQSEGRFGLKIVLESANTQEEDYEYILEPQGLLEQISFTGKELTISRTYTLPNDKGCFKKIKNISFYQVNMPTDNDSRVMNWNLLVKNIKIGYNSIETEQPYQATLHKTTDGIDTILTVSLLNRLTSKNFITELTDEYRKENLRVIFFQENLMSNHKVLGRGWGDKLQDSNDSNNEGKYEYSFKNSDLKKYQNYKAYVILRLTKEMRKKIAEESGVAIQDISESLKFVTNNLVIETKSFVAKLDYFNSETRNSLQLQPYKYDEEKGQWILDTSIIVPSLSGACYITEDGGSFSLTDKIGDNGVINIKEVRQNMRNFIIRIEANQETRDYGGFWEWSSQRGSQIMYSDKTVIEEGY